MVRVVGPIWAKGYGDPCFTAQHVNETLVLTIEQVENGNKYTHTYIYTLLETNILVENSAGLEHISLPNMPNSWHRETPSWTFGHLQTPVPHLMIGQHSYSFTCWQLLFPSFVGTFCASECHRYTPKKNRTMLNWPHIYVGNVFFMVAIIWSWLVYVQNSI